MYWGAPPSLMRAMTDTAAEAGVNRRVRPARLRLPRLLWARRRAEGSLRGRGGRVEELYEAEPCFTISD